MRHATSRAAILGVLCASVLAIAGCGSDDPGDPASPLDNALGYLGKDAPLAVSIDTDVRGDQYEAAGNILEKFPFGNSLIERIKNGVEEEGGDFKEIEPLLGNEFVVGATTVRSLVSGSDTGDFVGAIQTRSADKLEAAVKREKAKRDGRLSGATIYEDDDGDAFAVEEDVLIVAGSRRELDRALRQRDAQNRLREDDFDEATDELPKDALLRVYGDLERLLATDPSARDARKVEWVKALRTFGATVSFESDEANVDFRVSTDDSDLSNQDLPFASGSDLPSLIDRPGEIAVSLKDPTQIVDFAERAGEAIDPRGFGDYATAKRAVEKRLGVNIENDILKQLEGDLGVSFTVDGKYGVRAELKDPDRFDATLAKLGAVLPDIAEGIFGEPVNYAKPKQGGDFYALATADGDGVVYGVVDGVFVLANDPKIASQLAKAPTKRISGANGSVAVNADAEQLARQLLGRLQGLGGLLGGTLVTGPLGQLTGSMSAAEDGVRGNFKLTFD